MTPTRVLDKTLWVPEWKLIFQPKAVHYTTSIVGAKTVAVFTVEEGSSFIFEDGKFSFFSVKEVDTKDCVVAPKEILTEYEKVVGV